MSTEQIPICTTPMPITESIKYDTFEDDMRQRSTPKMLMSNHEISMTKDAKLK